MWQRVILQCQDGSISNKHSCEDQSGDTLLFLFKFKPGWINQEGRSWKPNLITFFTEASKREGVCFFTFQQNLDLDSWLPHKRIIKLFTERIFCLHFQIGRKLEKMDILSQMSGAFLLLQLSVGGSKQIIWFASSSHAQFLKMNTKWNFAAFSLKSFQMQFWADLNLKLLCFHLIFD